MISTKNVIEPANTKIDIKIMRVSKWKEQS